MATDRLSRSFRNGVSLVDPRTEGFTMAPEQVINRGTREHSLRCPWGNTTSDAGPVSGGPMSGALTLLLAMQGETISVDQMAICGAGE